MTQTHPERRSHPVVRLLGAVAAVVAMLAGIALLLFAIFAQFDTRSAIHPLFRPAALYSSFDEPPARLADPSNAYAVTSLMARLDSCTVLPAGGGEPLSIERDATIEHRSVLRFEAEPGAYDVSCSPDDVWFEIYLGSEVEQAVKGYSGPVHPSVYYLVGMVVAFGVGSWLWKRYVKRPREW